MQSLPVRLLAILTLVLASALVAGCSGERNDQAQPAAQAPAPAPEPATAPVPATTVDADVLARYNCSSGVGVVLLKHDKARATVPGQPAVDLQRIADSTPPVYTGANLYFDVGDEVAHLSQEDGTELACHRQ